MKIALIYHSGTGSTAFVASEIATELRKSDHDVQIFRINKISADEINGFDLIGIGSQTIAFRAPSFIINLLKSYPTMEQPYFIFNTCSGTPINTIPRISKTLKKKNWILLDYITLIGKGATNIQSWRPSEEKPVPDKDGLSEESLKKIPDFVKNVEKAYKDIIIDKTGTPKPVKSKFIMKVTYLFSDNLMSGFIMGKKSVDREKCTGESCGLCYNIICPSGCITKGSDGLPVFNEEFCVCCNGCVTVCPKSAIIGKGYGKYPYKPYIKYIVNPPK
ncbi:MAG: hypothetical protein GY870_19130 [archaeon]|nr:hypothetical protein [archaeon]